MLVWVSVQAPLHANCVPGHWQTPAVQLCPVAQALPHAPQSAVPAKSTQAPLHSVCGAVHVLLAAWHTPSAQICPVAQAFVQLPQ